MGIPKFDRLVRNPPKHILHHSDLTPDVSSACENLVGYSTAQPSLFKRQQLLPVRDLKLLARDYTVREAYSGRKHNNQTLNSRESSFSPLRKMH